MEYLHSLFNLKPANLQRMMDEFFLGRGDRHAKRTAFWVMLAASAVIATGGIVNESTAVIIGAMIVAPLMLPILGTAVAIVLSNGTEIRRSLTVVVLGALLVIIIGYIFGIISRQDFSSTTNSEIAARANPDVYDLVIALATGFIGAFINLRSDISSNALAGIAISISLVPPLAAVGLTLESGNYEDATNIMLLFITNVTAMLAMGTLMMFGARLRIVAREMGEPVGDLHGRSLAWVAVALVAITVPLATTTYQATRDYAILNSMTPVLNDWAQENAYTVVDVSLNRGVMSVSLLVDDFEPDITSLQAKILAADFDALDIRANYIIGDQQTYHVQKKRD